MPRRAEPRRLGTAALGASVCAAVHAAFGPIAAAGRIDAIAAAAERQSAGAGVTLMAQPASAAKANGMGSGRLSAAYPWLSRLSHQLAVAPPLVVIELCDAPLRFEVRQLYAADSAVRLSCHGSQCLTVYCGSSGQRVSIDRTPWPCRPTGVRR